MNDAEPALFDMPDPEPRPATRRPPRGRNRETWIMTAVAEVVITDATAVNEALAQAEANSLMIGWDDDSVDADPSLDDPQVEPATRALDQLAWLIWATDGQEALMEVDAFRVLEVACEMTDKTADRGTATWSVMVKLTDVDRLRRLATQAHPDEATHIADSLALAWQRAVDPFAPLRSIPGIDWRPKTVEVKHLPARTAPGSR